MAPQPGALCQSRQDLTGTLSALSRLPAGLLAPLAMTELPGVPACDAARLLGLSPEALKMRIHRARVAVRDSLASGRNQGGAERLRLRRGGA